MFPITGLQLIRFIPQKPPFVFIDSLDAVDENSCTTSFRISENCLLLKNGKLTHAGLLEHMAQSAGCKLGYDDFAAGKKSRRGFIGEVKDFLSTSLPAVNNKLKTEIIVEGKVYGAVTIVSANVFSGVEKIASCRMKIFFEQEE